MSDDTNLYRAAINELYKRKLVSWDDVWKTYAGRRGTREAIAHLLADNPNMTGREIGKAVGISQQAARIHKKRIQQKSVNDLSINQPLT